jgi:aryl-alcohol dehydrogenase-like predicted oxidoreductase
LLAGARTSLKDRSSTRRAETDTYAHELYGGPGDWEIVEAVDAVAEERGVSPAEVSLAWLLSRPGVTAPIVGATRLEHLDAALRALDRRQEPAEVQRLEAPYRPHEVQGHR